MIYFVQSGDGGPIKIGFTKSVWARVETLQTSSATKLAVLGVMPGGFTAEKALHSKFSSHRISGEWFRPDAELLAFIADTCDEPPPREPRMITELRTPFLSAKKALIALGERIRVARCRRQWTVKMLGERTGLTRQTVARIERGDDGVRFGSVAAALAALGMVSHLDDVAETDQLGRDLQDFRLPKRVRHPKST